ncbi:N-carbamoylputrescine amidase [Pseudomonas chlororaphis subsp. piscium]
MTLLTVATTQFACSWNLEDNLDQAEQLVREAAAKGAQLILLQELFATPYFCIEQDHKHLALAQEYGKSTVLKRFADLARELGVVLPLSWFERAGNAFFNSLAVADADGRLLGVYRKTHIPNAIGYQEKEYFSPGDTGFRVWDTAFGRIGVGICWDQWFPETARCLALMGAEVLLYPTAIGSEPGAAGLDSRDHWQLTQRGHAAANILPVIAANRIGHEVATTDPQLRMEFYGSSFITDHKGKLLAEADPDTTGVLVQRLDLAAMAEERLSWGIYRDRRPEMYGPLLGLDGRQTHQHWQRQGG